MKVKSIKKLILPILLIFSLNIFMSCSKNNKIKDPLTRTESHMGTVVKVTLYDSDSVKILDKAFDRVREIEEAVSINKTGTLLDKVNDSAGISPVKVDKDTFSMVKRGVAYSVVSDGLFDVSVGPLVQLWRIGFPDARVPSKEEIGGVLGYINYKDIELNENDQSIFLKKPHMIIDLGAVAKGYTADAISEVLTENNVNSAIIDLGGNIFAHGKKITGEDWTVGIQNPLFSRNNTLGTIKVNNKSVVTSGTYERFIEKDGIKYHHILSPKTGYPYDNNILGISIISDKSVDGDCLSTTIFAMGIENGLAYVETRPDIQAIFITADKKIYLSSGMKDLFKLSDTEFEIVN